MVVGLNRLIPADPFICRLTSWLTDLLLSFSGCLSLPLLPFNMRPSPVISSSLSYLHLLRVLLSLDVAFHLLVGRLQFICTAFACVLYFLLSHFCFLFFHNFCCAKHFEAMIIGWESASYLGRATRKASPIGWCNQASPIGWCNRCFRPNPMLNRSGSRIISRSFAFLCNLVDC